MANKIRWGVLGAAGIAVRKVIPAMQRSELAEVTAIASRSLAKAQAAAERLGIAKAYGSYRELLADPDIDAIYNPLPNHLHVPWSIKAAEAGKHVLCEKPIALSAAQALELLEARDRTGVRIGEAFMVRCHPQWLRAREIVQSGEIGELRTMLGAFSYFNRDPGNIRNNPKIGGGGLMDIGCYPITMSRFLFGEEPTRVAAVMELDPNMGTDRLTSAILHFPAGQAVFTCSTQAVPYQTFQILGSRGRIELEIPFNPPWDQVTRLIVDTGADPLGGGKRVEELPICDQFTIQGDLFSLAVRGEGPVPTPLEDSVANMKVIEAVARSANSGKWETV